VPSGLWFVNRGHCGPDCGRSGGKSSEAENSFVNEHKMLHEYIPVFVNFKSSRVRVLGLFTESTACALVVFTQVRYPEGTGVNVPHQGRAPFQMVLHACYVISGKCLVPGANNGLPLSHSFLYDLT